MKYRRLSDQPEVASRIVLLDEWVKTQMEYSGLPGLVIGIVQNQETVWSKAYGYADVETGQPMHTETIFRIVKLVSGLMTVAKAQAPSLDKSGNLILDHQKLASVWQAWRPKRSSGTHTRTWDHR